MRAVFLLVIVVGLTIFALQNVEPALSLVFLGVRSPQAPLSIWILLSMAAGVVTSLLISGLLAFSNYLSQPRGRTDRNSGGRNTFAEDNRTPYSPPPPPRKQEIDPHPDRETPPASSYRTEYGTPAGYSARTTFQQETPNPVGAKDGDRAGTYAAPDDEDDWVSDGSKSGSDGSDDDWGDDRDFPAGPPVNDVAGANPRNYEANQEPKSKSWAGSVYSYGYRDPKQSGVGKTESVYDAEYRVLVPPIDPIPKPADEAPKNPSAETEDDWGLDEDDVFDEDDRPSGPINLKK
ncbi:LapA family protein [Microcoleus sp. herbarium19]|uniref:LapA family protein n=1 Tax=unclassified Microcoleus TaxID=2642155 RepID=UPI002FD5AC8E